MKVNRKKELIVDLVVIMLISALALGFCGVLTSKIYPGFERDTSINVLLRVFVIGFLGQFGLAGLGISVVCLIRKDSFFNHGLNKKKLLPAIVICLICCIPELLYYLLSGGVYSWFPFIGVNFTYEVLKSGFPINVLAYLLIALFWGFFEGFNYVVIADKLNELLPSKFKYWDWGAFIMAVFCILIHGAVGVTPTAFVEMISTMILIYGMLLTRKLTGNAWGCVVIFFVYWNALNRYYPLL